MGYDFPLFPIADNPEYLQMMKRQSLPIVDSINLNVRRVAGVWCS